MEIMQVVFTNSDTMWCPAPSLIVPHFYNRWSEYITLRNKAKSFRAKWLTGTNAYLQFP